MFSQKDRLFKVHPQLLLEALVPQDHFYRQLERKLDLSFVRDLVRDCYSDSMGRPWIDPVVFFKLQLIMFFEGIRSERQLMEMVNVNLAHRWYLGYDLDEAVPDHSSLSKIRTRYGLDVCQRFFEQIVERCREAGLVWGQELYFDGTRVQANADVDSLVPRWYWAAKQHLDALFDIPPESDSLALRSLVDKYNGARFTGRRQRTYQRTADSMISLTDPDATPTSRREKARLGYHTHYVVDGGKARIILAVLVTPASIMDNTPMVDLARWTRFRWQLQPKIAVGNAKYGIIANIVALEADGIRAYVPIPDCSRRTGFYPPERFLYQADRDLYLCPQGQELPLHARRVREEVSVYRVC